MLIIIRGFTIGIEGSKLNEQIYQFFNNIIALNESIIVVSKAPL